MTTGQWVFLAILAICALLAWAYRVKVLELIEKIRTFYREVKGEMRRVAWPTRDEVIGNTVIVLVTASALGVLIFIADGILTKVVQAVFVSGGQ
jgi:preprotein translocase subunit SecE